MTNLLLAFVALAATGSLIAEMTLAAHGTPDLYDVFDEESPC